MTDLSKSASGNLWLVKTLANWRRSSSRHKKGFLLTLDSEMAQGQTRVPSRRADNTCPPPLGSFGPENVLCLEVNGSIQLANFLSRPCLWLKHHANISIHFDFWYSKDSCSLSNFKCREVRHAKFYLHFIKKMYFYV